MRTLAALLVLTAGLVAFALVAQIPEASEETTPGYWVEILGVLTFFPEDKVIKTQQNGGPET